MTACKAIKPGDAVRSVDYKNNNKNISLKLLNFNINSMGK
jgi:hypothetical protein